jgi:hypothetical protein
MRGYDACAVLFQGAPIRRSLWEDKSQRWWYDPETGNVLESRGEERGKTVPWPVVIRLLFIEPQTDSDWVMSFYKEG